MISRLLLYFFNWFTGLRKSKLLSRVSLVDLRREIIRCDQLEQKLLSQIQQLEEDKEVCFKNGCQPNLSIRNRRHLARAVKHKDSQIASLDKQQTLIAKSRETAEAVVQLFENQQLMAQFGLSKVLEGVDFSELQRYVEQASIDGQLKMDELARMMATAKDANQAFEGEHHEPEVDELVETMRQAAANHFVATTELDSHATPAPSQSVSNILPTDTYSH